ncbi:MAG: SRPBCC domain-containing protein [Actinomycetota bacterium]|nr:SRPBCC domain-containing protein [Actinomycetota bacterium]
MSDAAGRLLEVEAPHRLTFNFDEPARLDDPTSEPSLVRFQIEPYHDIVKLTVTQARLRSIEELDAIREGWPTVLPNFKTLLETGEVVPQAPWEFHAEQRAARMARNV